MAAKNAFTISLKSRRSSINMTPRRNTSSSRSKAYVYSPTNTATLTRNKTTFTMVPRRNRTLPIPAPVSLWPREAGVYVWQRKATAEVSACRRLFAIDSAQLSYGNLSTVNRPVAVVTRQPMNEQLASAVSPEYKCNRWRGNSRQVVV